MSGGRRGLHWRIKLPEELKNTTHRPRKTHKVPHNKEVIVISSDGENDQPSISPKKSRPAEPLSEQDLNARASTSASTSAIKTTTLPSHFLDGDGAPPRIDFQSTTGREGRRARAKRQNLEAFATTSEAGSLCDSAGIPVLQTSHHRSSSNDLFASALVNSHGSFSSTKVSTTLDRSPLQPSSSSGSLLPLAGLARPNEDSAHDRQDNNASNPLDNLDEGITASQTAISGKAKAAPRVQARRRGTKVRSLIRNVVQKALGIVLPVAEASAEAANSAQPGSSNSTSSPSAPQTPSSSSLSSPSEDVVKTCAALLAQYPSPNGAQAATVVELAIGKIHPRDDKAIRIYILHHGRQVGWANVYASSRRSRDEIVANCKRSSTRYTLARRLQTEVERIKPRPLNSKIVKAIDNAEWSALLSRAATGMGMELHSSTKSRHVTEQGKVPIACKFVLPSSFDAPNSLRPSFGQLAYPLGSKEAALVESLDGRSLQRIHLSVAASFAASIGLEKDVSHSLAAQAVSDHDPATHDDLCFIPDRSHPNDWACSFLIEPLREQVEELYAYRLFVEGVRRHIADRAAGGSSFDLKSWLREHSHDPFTPGRLPVYYYHNRGKPSIRVKREATFRDMESFRRASDLLVEILVALQEEHGRRWIVEHWDDINDAWFDVFMEAEMLADDDWAATNRGAFVEVIKGSASAGSSAGFCQGLITVGGLGHFHRAQEQFAPADLTDGLCLKHYLLSKLTEVKANWRRGPALNRKLINYDARRGHQLGFDDFEDIASRAPKTLLKPSDVDLQAFRARLGDDSFMDEWPATLRRLLPGLDADLLTKRPPNDKVPIYRRMVQIVYSLMPSLDLLRQYGGSGRLTGHKTPGAVSLLPSFFQRRKTTHPALSLLMFSAMQLARCGAQKALDQVQQFLEGTFELSTMYAKAGKCDPRHTRLSKDLVEQDNELHGIIADSDVGRPKLARVAAAIARSAAPPADAEKMAALYDSKPHRLLRLGRAKDNDVESSDGSGNSSGAKDAARLADNLARAYEEVEKMSPEREEELVGHFRKVASLIKSMLGDKCKTFRYNDDGMPTAFLPRSTPTKDVFLLAVKAWIRALDICDLPLMEKLGFIVWESDSWWRLIVVWLFHWARYGRRCPLTGLTFDLTGRRSHPLAVTLLAHKDHSRRFFDNTLDLTLEGLDEDALRRIAASNGCVQLWWVNRQIAFDHIAVILANIDYTRPACAQFLERLVDEDLVSLSPEEIKATMDGPPLAAGNVRQLLYNGGGTGGADYVVVGEDDEDDD